MDNITREERKENLRAWGVEQEAIALAYLLEKGYRLVKRNFTFGKAGEIDLVMRDREVYVFVEVKARKNHFRGTPEDAVDERKRTQLKRVARGFIHVSGLKSYEARFDVVAIDYATGAPGKPEIRHLIDAFR